MAVSMATAALKAAEAKPESVFTKVLAEAREKDQFVAATTVDDLAPELSERKVLAGLITSIADAAGDVKVLDALVKIRLGIAAVKALVDVQESGCPRGCRVLDTTAKFCVRPLARRSLLADAVGACTAHVFETPVLAVLEAILHKRNGAQADTHTFKGQCALCVSAFDTVPTLRCLFCGVWTC